MKPQTSRTCVSERKNDFASFVGFTPGRHAVKKLIISHKTHKWQGDFDSAHSAYISLHNDI